MAQMLQQLCPKALSMVAEKAYQGITHNVNEGTALIYMSVWQTAPLLGTTQVLVVLGG